MKIPMSNVAVSTLACAMASTAIAQSTSLPGAAVTPTTVSTAVLSDTRLTFDSSLAPSRESALSTQSMDRMFDTGVEEVDRLALKPLSLSLFDQPESTEPLSEGDGSSNSQNSANNPLTPKITINFHNYYVPSYYGSKDRQSDQFLLRGIIPHKIGDVPQLFRFTLPIANAPTFPDGSDTGLGDLTLIDYFVFKESGLEFGVGPVFVLPTASTEALGAGKWQAGASGLVVAPQKWGLLGGVLTFQQSFASQGGDSDRDDVTLLQFQPLAIYNLPHGFYLRSTAIWNFDLNNDTYYLPVGMGAGFVHEVDRVSINAFVEPQYTLFHDGVAPQWQIFAGVNFQIAF